MPAISRYGYGNLPAWNGVYCEFRTNPVGGKRAAGAPTGTENDRNLFAFGGHGNVPGLVMEHNPIGTQTILAPVVAAGGLDLGSQDQTDNDGMQLHFGGEAMGVGQTQFVVGQVALIAQFLDVVIADVSGTDALLFGWRKVEAVAADHNDYNDLAALNIVSGTIKTDTILTNAATVQTSSAVAWADAAKKSLMVKVAVDGSVTYFYSTDAAFDSNGYRQPQAWTALPNAVAYTFTAGLTVMPFLFARQDADVMGVVTIRALEAGVA